MKQTQTIKQTLSITAMAAVMWACGGGGSAGESSSSDATANVDESKMVAEITNSLQACSYDGAPLTLSPQNIEMNTNEDAAKVVAEIMKFTGLPQNFEVFQADVPNAAAVIVVGKDRLPHRVIAYNKAFLNEVRRATQNNDWAPLSVLAHEIGHHLCGHTIMPGGSQPPTELEADKFSGFVLYKMGAVMPDAQKAINTLIPEQDGPTHPGRAKRLAAIEEGWKQACNQQSFECSGMVAANKAGGQPVAEPAGGEIASSTPATEPGTVSSGSKPVSSGPPPTENNAVAAGTSKPDVIPAATENGIPTKFDRFVIDEIGIMNAGVKNKLAQTLFDYAKNKNIEIVTIIAKDLNGKSADAYAYDMLRQLRVGQLEVGNGACLVIAPNQNDVGVALMSALRFEFDDRTVEKGLKSGLKFFMDYYNKWGTKYDMSEHVYNTCDRIIRDTRHWEWVVRYQNLDDMLKVDKEEFQKKKELSGPSDPMSSLVWRKMVRVRGTLVSKNGNKNNTYNNPYSVPGGGKTMEFKTEDGKYVVLYATKYTESIMPVGLEEGKTYSFVLRERSLHQLAFDLISYDQVK